MPGTEYPDVDCLSPECPMALTSTMYNFDINLADTDREIYLPLKCAAALHPSETLEFMATRVLAYCLEYHEQLVFTKGLSDATEPALWSKHLDGRIMSWIEVGTPAAARLHKAAKISERVAVYTHKAASVLMHQLKGETIYRREEIPIYSFEPNFLSTIAQRIERRTRLNISRSERQIYLDIGGETFLSVLEEQRAGTD